MGSTSASHDFISIEKMILHTSSCVNNLNTDIGLGVMPFGIIPDGL